MTAIARTLAVVVAHRAGVAVCLAVAVVALLGLIASARPLDVQGLVVAPFLVMGTLAVFRRGLTGLADGTWLMRIATIGTVMRLAFVALHLVIGYWFYAGAVDFIGWQQIVADILEALAAGTVYDFDSLRVASGIGGLGTGNRVSLVLLTAIGIVTGPTLIGMFSASAVLGAAGTYLYLRAYQISVPDRVSARFLARVLFLVPSIGFWSVYLGKDSLAFFLLASCTYGFVRMLVRPTPMPCVQLVASLALLVGVRPHMGVAVGIGVALALGFQPLQKTGPVVFLWPLKRLALLAAVGVFGAVVITQGFLQVGLQAVTLEALAERAYTQQSGFVGTAAGSALPPTMESGDPAEVAGAIPFGVFTLMFRPLPWEAHNVLAIVAAAENVFLLGLLLRRRRALLASLRAATSQPLMLYSLAVFLAGAITLSFNWNLGTLARHRTMVLPFFAILLAGPGPRTEKRRRPGRAQHA